MTLRVEGLWRYPVKSLAGEALKTAELTADGIPGDRIVHVRGPEALAAVKTAAGDDAWLDAYEGLERFDVLPLLVATDGAVAAFGHDIRRLRPNILIGGVHGMDEIDWPGNELHIGEAVIQLDSRRGRCPMTTVDPDTLERDPEALQDIVRRFNGQLALNADVLHPGMIRIGDAVTLKRAAPTSTGNMSAG